MNLLHGKQNIGDFVSKIGLSAHKIPGECLLLRESRIFDNFTVARSKNCHMNKVAKWGAVAVILLCVIAAMASCSSTRRLGCPMKITRVSLPLQVPAC
jgi:hypothetical protein